MGSVEKSAYITLREYANRYHYSDRHVRRLCKEGKIDAIKPLGKWLIPEAVVMKRKRVRRRTSQLDEAAVSVKSPRGRHFEDLSATLQKLLVNLKWVRRFKGLEEEFIGDITPTENQRDEIESVNEYLASYLLSHVQAELPELKDLKAWGRLKVGAITDEFLDRLSVIAYRHTFQGTCTVCESRSTTSKF